MCPVPGERREGVGDVWLAAVRQAVEMTNDAEPGRGYGRSGRRLCRRDDEAERIRRVLERASFPAMSSDAVRYGHAVEGGGDGQPFRVSHVDYRPGLGGRLDGYVVALRAAGYRVEPTPDGRIEVRPRLVAGWWARLRGRA